MASSNGARVLRVAALSILGFWLAALATSAAGAASVDSFAALSEAISACFDPPPGSEGSEVTLRFGLTGRGALRGSPMVTYSRLVGSPALKQAFALAAVHAVIDCTPVGLTDAFGRVVAQRVLTLRFGQKVRPRQSI
jgi:hypothetical protein